MTLTPPNPGKKLSGRAPRNLKPIPVLSEIGNLSPIPKGQLLVGTLSFAARYRSLVRDNTDTIVEIIGRRQPPLLLVAGWSVEFGHQRDRITEATRHSNTTVVLEVVEDNASYHIAGGKADTMGRQFLGSRQGLAARKKKGQDPLGDLANAVGLRSFPFWGKTAFLLVCGEINVLVGTNLPKDVPAALRAALEAPDTIFLNPTHTRLPREWVLDDKRKLLSGSGRTYISASNWTAVPRKGGNQQHVGPSIQTVWHGGEQILQHDQLGGEAEGVCYREWILPPTVRS